MKFIMASITTSGLRTTWQINTSRRISLLTRIKILPYSDLLLLYVKAAHYSSSLVKPRQQKVVSEE